MIKLEVEEYCDDCPEFDAHIEKAVLFDGYSKEYCNTNITCEHKDKCKRLKDMIKCRDCRFGGLKVLLDNESAPCLRLDDEECPNYNEETGEIKLRNAERRGE